MTYLGLTKDQWDLIFGAVNALVIVLGLPFALRTFQQSVRQRMNESLTKLLDEYRGVEFRDSVRAVIAAFPLFTGTIDERIEQFVEYGRENLERDHMLEARNVVHKLNDIGAFVEQGGVREQDFFGQTFPRVLEIASRLEPLVLCLSCLGTFRWGMRLRRLRLGATRYVKQSPIHSTRDIVIDGHVLVPKGRSPWRRRIYEGLRRLAGLNAYIPSKERAAAQDAEDLAATASVLKAYKQPDLRFLTTAV